MRIIVLHALLGWSLLALTLGCGSSSGQSPRSILGISVENDSLQIHEETILHLQFEFLTKLIFEEDGHLAILVRLPSEFSIRKGSSKLIVEGHEEHITEQITPCQGSEETFLLYDIDADDLEKSDNFEAEGFAELIIAIKAKAQSDAASISATVDESPPLFSCGVNFSGEAEVQVQIS